MINYKNINLVTFDLDGTLLNDAGEIGSSTIQLVEELKQEHGVRFTFASGRMFSALEDYAQQLKLNEPLITVDGSLIKTLNGEILYKSFINKSHVERALDFANKHVISAALCQSDEIFYTEQNSVIPQIMDKFGAKYREVESYDEHLATTLEVVLAGDNKDAIKYIQDKMSFPYTFGLNSSYFKSQSHEGIFYLELRKKGSSKGKAFLRLAKYLNIEVRNCVVIGDWYNDLSLFNTHAVKVAVNNAVAEIKNLADVILEKSNNEDATAELLEKILKAKKN